MLQAKTVSWHSTFVLQCILVQSVLSCNIVFVTTYSGEAFAYRRLMGQGDDEELALAIPEEYETEGGFSEHFEQGSDEDSDTVTLVPRLEERHNGVYLRPDCSQRRISLAFDFSFISLGQIYSIALCIAWMRS